MAAAWSAEERPLPRNVWGGFWYTDARVERFGMSVSRRGAGRTGMVELICGRAERTMFFATCGSDDKSRQ